MVWLAPKTGRNGRADEGKDLVISRDDIREGLRGRAQDLITQELGPRHDHEIRRGLMRQVEAERWTALDRQLVRDAGKSGVIDMAAATHGPRATTTCRRRSGGCGIWDASAWPIRSGRRNG